MRIETRALPSQLNTYFIDFVTPTEGLTSNMPHVNRTILLRWPSVRSEETVGVCVAHARTPTFTADIR